MVMVYREQSGKRIQVLTLLLPESASGLEDKES